MTTDEGRSERDGRAAEGVVWLCSTGIPELPDERSRH